MDIVATSIRGSKNQIKISTLTTNNKLNTVKNFGNLCSVK